MNSNGHWPGLDDFKQNFLIAKVNTYTANTVKSAQNNKLRLI